MKGRVNNAARAALTIGNKRFDAGVLDVGEGETVLLRISFLAGSLTVRPGTRATLDGSPIRILHVTHVEAQPLRTWTMLASWETE